LKTAAQIISQFKTLTHFWPSCSVVNADGHLLYSNDREQALLTTTRLVAFQIVKKYLRPQALDLFILNDPENGGFQYQRPLFIAGLSNNLFVIWDTSLPLIDFKIPPTPLFDKGIRNEFVWKAMVEAHPQAQEFTSALLQQKTSLDRVLSQKQLVSDLSNPKNQQQWFKISQEAFGELFSNKAYSSFEASHRLNASQIFKLKISAEEKQNLKQINLDMSNTSLAQDIFAASHVIESAMIKRIVDFYEMGDFFTQMVLDKIKTTLPPRSIVSKAHPLGLYSYDLQSIAHQICDYCLTQMNSPLRKGHTQFEYKHFLLLRIHHSQSDRLTFLSAQRFDLKGFEDLTHSHRIRMKVMKRTDQSGRLDFEIIQPEGLGIQFLNLAPSESSAIQLKVNDQPQRTIQGQLMLKQGDQVQLEWSF
jgi:hypothetical protein